MRKNTHQKSKRITLASGNRAVRIKAINLHINEQISRLTVVIQDELEKNPFISALFLFCNRQRHIHKVIW